MADNKQRQTTSPSTTLTPRYGIVKEGQRVVPTARPMQVSQPLVQTQVPAAQPRN